jgi:hypothetical protein
MLISVKMIPFRTLLRFMPETTHEPVLRSILKAAGGGFVFLKYKAELQSFQFLGMAQTVSTVCTLGPVAPTSEEHEQLKRTVTDIRAMGGHMRMPGTCDAKLF